MASTTCGTPGYVAPEIIEGLKYGCECDYWSLGVLTYVLLSGTQPFYDNDSNAIFDKIRRCEFNFNDNIWKRISKEAQDFISKLIVLNPKERMNFE